MYSLYANISVIHALFAALAGCETVNNSMGIITIKGKRVHKLNPQEDRTITKCIRRNAVCKTLFIREPPAADRVHRDRINLPLNNKFLRGFKRVTILVVPRKSPREKFAISSHSRWLRSNRMEILARYKKGEKGFLRENNRNETTRLIRWKHFDKLR